MQILIEPISSCQITVTPEAFQVTGSATGRILGVRLLPYTGRQLSAKRNIRYYFPDLCFVAIILTETAFVNKNCELFSKKVKNIQKKNKYAQKNKKNE